MVSLIYRKNVIISFRIDIFIHFFHAYGFYEFVMHQFDEKNATFFPLELFELKFLKIHVLSYP